MMAKAPAKPAARPKPTKAATVDVRKPALPAPAVEGLQARILGKLRGDCPHKSDTEDGLAWLAGWDSAEAAFQKLAVETLGPWHVHVYTCGQMAEFDVQALNERHAKSQAMELVGQGIPGDRWKPSDAARIAIAFGPPGERKPNPTIENPPPVQAAPPGK